MNDKIRIAVVGCGAIGNIHARVIVGLQNAQLVAVLDVKLENAQKFAGQYGCNAYADFKEMFRQEKIDIVCICTPSGMRLDICRAAAEDGVNILVEKPLDITYEHTEEIINTCNSAGIKLGCVFQLRFLPVFRCLKKAVEEGRFGRLILGNANTICYRSDDYYKDDAWRGTVALDGGGALMNQGIHNVDLLRWIMGDVKSVSAYKSTLTHDIEVEDTTVASIEFVNGAIGTIEASTSIYYGIDKKLEVFGSEGSVIINGVEPVMWQFKKPFNESLDTLKNLVLIHKTQNPTNPLVDDIWAHQQQLLDMIEAVKDNRPPAVSGRDAQKSVELVLAIYESARTRQRVYLPLTRLF